MDNNNNSDFSSNDNDLVKLGLSTEWIVLFKLNDNQWRKLFAENDPDGKWKALLTDRKPELGAVLGIKGHSLR
jgi:hypothetical protein